MHLERNKAMTNEAVTLAPRPYVILAAVAFDETSHVALQEAVRCAELQQSADLHLVHVLANDVATVDGSLTMNAWLAEAPEELRRRVNMLRVGAPHKITAHLRMGSPVECIVQTAVDIDADLLVLGSAKRRGLDKLMFGSVASSVLQQARCPVLVAAPKDHLRSALNTNIEPVCTECERERSTSGGTRYWCERQSHARMLMHVYTPSEAHAAPLIR
jgi:nucleotide-binding universal stress UspA family protein